MSTTRSGIGPRYPARLGAVGERRVVVVEQPRHRLMHRRRTEPARIGGEEVRRDRRRDDDAVRLLGERRRGVAVPRPAGQEAVLEVDHLVRRGLPFFGLGDVPVRLARRLPRPPSQPQSMRSVELRTVTPLFAGRIGGPPMIAVARLYRVKTTVPITLSRPENGGAAAVASTATSAADANATAATSGASVSSASFATALSNETTAWSTRASGSVIVAAVFFSTLQAAVFA